MNKKVSLYSPFVSSHLNTFVSSILFCFCVSLISCGGDDESVSTNTNSDEQTATTLRSRAISLFCGTRSYMEETDEGDMHSTWVAGDCIFALNSTQTNLSLTARSATLQTLSSGDNVTFKGGNITCKKGDELRVFYPIPNGDQVVLNSDGTLTLSMLGQQGNKASLSTSYDYTLGKAIIEEARLDSADAATTAMANLMALVRLEFRTETDAPLTATNIARLVIKAEEGSLYSQFIIDPLTHKINFRGSDIVESMDFTSCMTSLNGTTNGDVSTPSDFYLAIFPRSYRLSFIVTTDEGDEFTGEMDESREFSQNSFTIGRIVCR